MHNLQPSNLAATSTPSSKGPPIGHLSREAIQDKSPYFIRSRTSQLMRKKITRTGDQSSWHVSAPNASSGGLRFQIARGALLSRAAAGLQTQRKVADAR